MIETSLLDECRTLAFRIAPELAQSPLYVVDASIFNGLPLTNGRCLLGWALQGSSHCIYSMREAIGDQWQGNGNVIALCNDAIRKDAINEDAFRERVLNVMLHEIAHLLPSQYVPLADRSEIFDCELVRQHQHRLMAEAQALPEPPIESKDNCHNSAFVRRCVHLWSRSRLAGWSIPSPNLFGGDLWFLSQPAHYLESLFSELVGMRTANFTTIEDNDPPKEFLHQWQYNLAFHKSLNPGDKQ